MDIKKESLNEKARWQEMKEAAGGTATGTHAPICLLPCRLPSEVADGCPDGQVLVSTTQLHNVTRLPIPNTTALGMFCGAKYTHLLA